MYVVSFSNVYTSNKVNAARPQSFAPKLNSNFKYRWPTFVYFPQSVLDIRLHGNKTVREVNNRKTHTALSYWRKRVLVYNVISVEQQRRMWFLYCRVNNFYPLSLKVLCINSQHSPNKHFIDCATWVNVGNDAVNDCKIT